jgi:hypothetical protein
MPLLLASSAATEVAKELAMPASWSPAWVV